MSVTIEHARRLHDLGLCVIPIKDRDKRPAVGWQRYQTERPTERDLEVWFGPGTSHNIGVTLGPVSGVVVIDTDSPETEAWARTLLPTTMMTRTARGFHRYYRLPSAFADDDAVLPPFVGPNRCVELRRKGHYVLGPGSVHPTGHVYEMVEDWPSSLADVPVLPLALLKPVVATSARAPKLTPTIAAGRRNATLFTEACRLRRLGYDRDEIRAALAAVNQKRCDPPLPDTDIDGLASRAAAYDPAADTYPLTEAGDAEFFAAQFGERLRFDHRRGRWLLFNDHLWVPDTDAGIHRLALDAVRARQRAAIGHKDRVTWAVKGESHGRLRHLLEIAKTLQPIADDGSQWDLDPWRLGVANGILDLRTGTLRDGRPDDRVTMTCSVAFAADATCPAWDAFLQEVFDDDAVRAYVQRACGYSLTGDCQEECLFFCWGEGANGKSTLLGAVGFTLGDYADDLPFSALEWQDRGGSIPNDIAKIVGRRFITSSESGESKRLNEARVKALTGRDPITARFLHQEFFTFQPMAKFWLASNSKPIVRDNSAGFWRRLHLIPFTQSFVGRENKTLKDDLRREASGILAWAVRGCLAWQRDGLNPPAVVRQATDDYRQESDVLAPFYDACCTIDPAAHVQASALFARYQRWCESNHIWKEQRLTQKAFGLKIRGRFEADEKRGVVTYRGIGLQPQPDAVPSLDY